jgi:DNA-binding protein HU-beta
MNKTDFIAYIAEKTGYTKKDVESHLDMFLDSIIEVLKKEGKLQLTGFGIFEVVERCARDCRNPQTGEVMHLQPSKSVKFKVGKNLKDSVTD